jgi:hypothetical protein
MILFCFYGFNVLADSCASWSSYSPRDGQATIIANTEQVHLNEIEMHDFVYADSMDFEFWIEKCINDYGITYSLFATVTPIIPGKSKGSGVYDIAVIQDNQQFNGALSFTNNLYVPGSIWTALTTTYSNSGAISSTPAGLDLSQPFTLIFSCSNSFSYFEDCSVVNPASHFEINPQSGQNNTVISSVNGAWYDPDYNGSGFNMVQTANGLQVYFYGYKAGADGKALWLASFLGPKTIHKGETFTLEMTSGFIGNGGSLTSKPNTPNSGLTLWGTADITFDSCSSGEIILTNTDGDSVTHDIILLAGAEGLNCE